MKLSPRGSLYVEIFGWCCAVAFTIDLFIVELGIRSISATVWEQTAKHPTLIAAGTLVTCFVAYLVRENWRAVLLAGMLGGHLFIHW